MLEKIKRLLADEHAECTISSPVDKLETFFINIVAAAQQQAVPTSGAESKTRISDFLAAKPDEQSRRAAILDQLVSAGLSAEGRDLTKRSRSADEIPLPPYSEASRNPLPCPRLMKTCSND